MYPYGEEELEELYSRAVQRDQRLADILLVRAWTGLRWSELVPYVFATTSKFRSLSEWCSGPSRKVCKSRARSRADQGGFRWLIVCCRLCVQAVP
jgi:hypothetical protein